MSKSVRKRCSQPGCRRRRMGHMMYCQEHLGLHAAPEPPSMEEHLRWLKKVIPVMGKEDLK